MTFTIEIPAREVPTGTGPMCLPDGVPVSTVFDGQTITSSRSDGQVITTVFEAAGTVLTTYGAPMSVAIRTTFNADGSITEAEV